MAADKAERREIKYWLLLRRRRQYQFLRAVLVGLLAGGIAVLFERLLWALESLRITLSGNLQDNPLRWIVFPLLGAVAGGAAGYITQHFSPEAAGSGIPQIKAVLMNLRPLQKRLLPVKFFGGIVAIGAGFSLGREGPTVQMGAVAGKVISQILKVPQRFQLQLIAAGAGAGLAAAFNAPLAGFIFVIEELQREMSPLTYGTALIGAVVADIVTRYFSGQMPSFQISGYPTPSLWLLPLFVLLGGVCGVLGSLFNRGLLSSLNFTKRLSLRPRWLLPALTGVVVGLMAVILPAVVGGGHWTADNLLRGNIGVLLGGFPKSINIIWFLVILLVGKFFLTQLCYASGVPGGIFAPFLVLGAVAGMLVGELSALLLPSAVQTPATFGVLGMAGMFASIVRAPLTGVVLILEMTGNYAQLFALLVTAMVSYVVADHLGTKPIYDALLERDLEEGELIPEHEAAEPTLLNFVVEPHSEMEGKRIKEVAIPKGCLIVDITRAGKEIVPGGNTVLFAGDQITVLSSGKGGCNLKLRDLAQSITH